MADFLKAWKGEDKRVRMTKINPAVFIGSLVFEEEKIRIIRYKP
jgi:hypothetical protein